jgi:hypothetical protein
VYFVMWVIMPLDSEGANSGWKEPEPPPGEPNTEEVPAAPSGSESAGAAGWEPTGTTPPRFRRRESWYGPDYHHYVGRKKRSAGIVLMALGLLFLSSQAGLLRWINWSVAWAVVLIVLGAALLMRHTDWRM